MKVVDTFHTPARSPRSPVPAAPCDAGDPFLAYFTTRRANNGGTEAIDGIMELHRRLARGSRNRNNYRLRVLLDAGGLTP